MRILGIDVGTKKVGLAVSDGLGITAQGLIVLRRDDNNFLSKLKEVIREKDIREIVVGLPLNMDGTYGPKAHEAIAFSDYLKTETKLSVKLWDERMSTVEVERIMIQADTSRAKRKKKIDKVAAQVILQNYLDREKQRGKNV